MATSIIDALIVTLGLDSTEFKKGKAEADAALKDTKNVAVSAADDIAGGIGKLALKFTGLFTAIAGVASVVDFFKNLNHEISDLGYTSRQLGESAGNLRLYQQIAEGFGGTAKGVTGTVASLETAMFNMRQMGQMSDQLVAWQRFGGGLPQTNAAGGIDMLASINQVRRAMSGLAPQEANQRMLAMGLDEGTRNAVLASTADLAKWTEAQKKSATQVGANTKAAQDLERSWLQLKNDAVGLSATVLGQTTPALEAMFATIDNWVNSEGFSAALKTIADSLRQIRDVANDIATGEWRKALGDLFNGDKDPTGNPGVVAGNWIHNKVSGAWNSATLNLRRTRNAPYLAALEKQYGLPAGIMDKMIMTESRHNPSAVSPKGAVGIAQLMPQFHPGAGTNPATDEATMAQTLSALHRQFGGDKGDPDWSKAISAYNVGGGALGHALNSNDAAAAATRASAGRYLDKVLGSAAAPPTGSMRAPASLSIGEINLTLPGVKNATDLANGLADAIQRRFNVFQTDTGLA